jgi:hypothetical protein
MYSFAAFTPPLKLRRTRCVVFNFAPFALKLHSLAQRTPQKSMKNVAPKKLISL